MKQLIIVFIFLSIFQVYGEKKCTVTDDQYYDLSQKVEIYDFNESYYNYDSNLPVPSENYLMMFKFYRTGNREKTDLFIPSSTDDQYLTLKFRYNYLQVILNSTNGSNYIDVKLSDKFDKKYTAFAFYITKSSMSVYYDGQLLKSKSGNFTLGQFSGTYYNIDEKENDARGYMKEFSIAQDIGEYQLSCLVEYKDIAICPVGNVYMNTKCMDCLKFSSSLYNVNMKGSSSYNVKQNTIDFSFKAIDLYVPSCTTGSLNDINGNQISYQGSIDNLTFTYTQQQVDSLCPIKGGKITCHFKYTLQIQNSIQVNFAVSAVQQANYEVSANKTYGGKLNSTSSSALLDYEQNPQFEGVVVNKNYSFKTIFNGWSQIVFYSSPLFQFPLGDKPYSYGSNIFAQLQVSELILQQGYKLQFKSATLNQQTIQPYEQSYSNEGYLNLSFQPFEFLESEVITIDIVYALVQQNATQQSTQLSATQQLMVIDIPKEKFLQKRGQEKNSVSLYDNILSLFD